MKKILSISITKFVFYFLIFGGIPTFAVTEIDVNSFGSIYYGQAFSPHLLPYGFYDEFPNFSSFSLLGFNISSRVSDRMSVAAQFIAAVPTQSAVVATAASAPNTHWEVRAKWGFINYDLTPSVTIKAGRQLLPVMFASEFSSVGYLMPYRQIPISVQSTLPFSGFDGISATYTHSTALGELRLIGFTGTGNIDTGYTISGSEHNLLGLTVQLRGDGLQLHTSYYREDADITVNLPGGGSNHAMGALNGLTFGYRYDKHNLVSWGEYSYRWNPNSKMTFIPDLRGGYVLVGYKMGSFMPRYTYTFSDQTVVRNYIEGAEHSHTLGLNYQVDSKTILKAEWEIIEVESGEAPITSVRSGSTTSKNGSAAYVGVDFIF